MIVVAGYPFPFLMDAPEAFLIEDWAWVALPLAASADDAPRALVEAYSSGGVHPMEDEDEPTTFICRGTEWTIAKLEDFGDTRQTVWGEVAEKAARAHHDLEESLYFVKSEPGAYGAREWWKIERVEACHHLIEETDDGDLIHCTLPAGHSVPVDRSLAAHEVQPWIWPR